MEKYIGKKLDGRYEITELIGVGGMAEVYKGVDVIDNKPVAIKILKKEYAENEEFLRRFRNESKAIAVLSHPNIVKIYDVGFSDKLQYIVMEYIDGITLKEYIEEEKVLTWKDTVHFVIQILRALQHAHDKGIVHRDIKPQNIMMFSDGTIKVMDFGIAKFAREEGKTATDQAIGSVHYISPEQASGAVTDAKSDIYSVGAMMYEMLSGRKPFDSDNPVAIAVMHMQDIPERPRAVNPDIPDGLEEIILKAMEKAPADRYSNTGEMIADIEKFKANPTMTFGYYREEGVDDNADTQYYAAGEIELPPADEAPVTQKPVYAGAAVNAGAGGGRYPQQRNQPYGNLDDYYDDYEDDDDEEETERTSLVVPVLTAIIVVVIIVGVIFISMLFKDMLQGSSQTNDWSMPDVVGWDFEEARNTYGDNIKFQEDGQEFNEAEAGVIIEQSIEPGSQFKKGDVLKVVISKGMETEEVPDVKNKNGQLAKAELEQLDFVVEIKNSSSTDVKKGNVIKTEPEAGQKAHKGSTIIVYVSLGEDAGQIAVEKYVGMTVDEAYLRADYAGLKVITKGAASYEPEGQVIKQSIDEGEKVEKGSEIELTFSNGKKPDGEVSVTYDLPAEANGRFVIAFMVQKEDGSPEIQESGTFYCPEYAQITQSVIGSGENVNVTVMVTNEGNDKRATIGTYNFNFAEGTYSSISGEDVYGAFEAIGAFPEPETEAPTEAPTEQYGPPVTDPPSDPVQGVNGDYVNGEWVWYSQYNNGDYKNGTWTWYSPDFNGEWINGSEWKWYEPDVNGYWQLIGQDANGNDVYDFIWY